MKTSVPFTAFCPECNGHRTFTIIRETSFGSLTPHVQPNVIEVGCCICGTPERDALVAVSDRMQDDRATIGEMAARLNTLDGEVTELRDDHLDLARAHDRLYDKVRAQQERRLLRVIEP